MTACLPAHGAGEGAPAEAAGWQNLPRPQRLDLPSILFGRTAPSRTNTPTNSDLATKPFRWPDQRITGRKRGMPCASSLKSQPRARSSQDAGKGIDKAEIAPHLIVADTRKGLKAALFPPSKHCWDIGWIHGAICSAQVLVIPDHRIDPLCPFAEEPWKTADSRALFYRGDRDNQVDKFKEDSHRLLHKAQR